MAADTILMVCASWDSVINRKDDYYFILHKQSIVFERNALNIDIYHINEFSTKRFSASMEKSEGSDQSAVHELDLCYSLCALQMVHSQTCAIPSLSLHSAYFPKILIFHEHAHLQSRHTSHQTKHSLHYRIPGKPNLWG